MNPEIPENGESDYMAELAAEKELLVTTMKHAPFLIAQEIDRVQTSSKKMLELHHNKPSKVETKVRIPVKEHPLINFVGKILGPKGSNLKQLQEETGTKMIIQGRGSMRDRAKEEELRREGGKHAHLHEDLHVLIEVFGLPAECHHKLSIALQKLSQFLLPEGGVDSHNVVEPHNIDGGMPPGMGRGRGLPPPPPNPGWMRPPGMPMPPPRGGRPGGLPPPRPMPPPPRPGWSPNGRGSPAGGPPGGPRHMAPRPPYPGPPRPGPPPNNGYLDYQRPRDHTIIPAESRSESDMDFTTDSWPAETTFGRVGKAPTSWSTAGQYQRVRPYSKLA